MQSEFMWEGLTCKTAEKALWNKYGAKVGHIDMMEKIEDNVWVAYNEMGEEFRIVAGRGRDGSTIYYY